MSKASLLIVEDEQIVALDLQNNLENCGYRIMGRSDQGEAAVRQAAALQPDLVLMDIGLKGPVDGIEAATRIRTQLHLPVIFITAFADEATVRRARPAEPYGYILKPFDERELISNIEMALYKHRMEMKLRESEARFRGILEHSADGMVLADRQGKLIEWNPAAERLTGLKRSEALGQSLPEIICRLLPKARRTPGRQAELASQWAVRVENLYASGLDQMVEIEIETPQGQRRVVQANGFAVETVEGALGGAILRDITEHKQAEQLLRESEAHYKLMFESAPIAINITRGATITYANPSYLEMFGFSSQEALNRYAPLELFTPESRSQILENIQRRAEGRPTANAYEAECLRPDGTRFPVLMFLTRTVFADGPATVAFILDITERKRTEKALHELNAALEQRVAERTAQLDDVNQELNASNQELNAVNLQLTHALHSRDEFLASMSHELRTPLTGILGVAEALQLNVYGPLTGIQRQSLQTIYECGEHLLALITDILDLSKIDADKLALSLAPVSVADVCQASLHLVKGQASQKGFALQFRPDAAVTIVQADERRLKQILVNLLSNGVKFTPEGGQVGLDVRGDAARGEAHFTVWDTGVGIAPGVMPRLFKPFVQLDNRLNRENAGTGLGLALTHALVQLHGGRLTLESEGIPGQGSRFTVSLPWRPPVTRALAPAPSAFAGGEPALPLALGAGERVLLADDNPTVLFFLAETLSARGYHVQTAANGPEALAQAAAFQPALIVLDVQMPGLDGLEVLRQLRSTPRFAQTPVIILTALAMPGDRDRCLAAGATAYLAKPVNLPTLVTKIGALIAQAAADGQR